LTAIAAISTIDERLGSLVREGAKRLTRAELLDLADDLLDARLRLTNPRAEPTVCGICDKPVTARPFVNEHGVSYVVECPACDYTKCSPCGRMVYDRKTRRCMCGAPIRFEVKL